MSIGLQDREKFKVYEHNEAKGALVQQQQKSAQQKMEEAGQPKDGDQDMTNMAARMGRAIVVADFIRILQRLNPNLIFELSKGDATKYGIYIDNWDVDLKTNLPVKTQPRFITGMESGINLGGRINEGVMPEFSIMLTEDTIVPVDHQTIKKIPKFKREIRGWRTVLAALYSEGLLTEPQIEATFKINEGRDSANWQRKINGPRRVNRHG